MAKNAVTNPYREGSLIHQLFELAARKCGLKQSELEKICDQAKDGEGADYQRAAWALTLGARKQGKLGYFWDYKKVKGVHFISNLRPMPIELTKKFWSKKSDYRHDCAVVRAANAAAEAAPETKAEVKTRKASRAKVKATA